MPPVAPQSLPAFAIRDTAGKPIGTTHRVPTRTAAQYFDPYATARASGAPLLYHQGPVQTMPAIYVVYWGFHRDPFAEAMLLTRFYNAVGASSWLGTVTQYYQNGPVGISSPRGQLRGTWYDNAAPVPAHPSDAQVAAEAVRLAEHFGDYSVNASFVVATPTGHETPGFRTQWCAYHSRVASHGTTLPYTNFPYVTDAGQGCGAFTVNGAPNGILDGITILAGHELAETQTDPLLNAWFDASGNEIGDKCAWIHLRNVSFGTFGSFPMQPLWSDTAGTCLL